MDTQVVIVGDSHMEGEIGKTLQGELQAKGYNVVRRAVVGSTILFWATDGPITPDQDRYPIIALGTNDFSNSDSYFEQTVPALLKRFKKKGIWVGLPPMMRPDVLAQLERVNATLARLVKAAGWEFVPYNWQNERPDEGIHFSGEDAQSLGKKLAKDILNAGGWSWVGILATGVIVAGASWAVWHYREQLGLTRAYHYLKEKF